MPKISVIVPVYKVEQYLDRCVESILAQTFTDFELILVDDGSPDNCPKMCDEWAKKDERIVVIHQENGGLSAARNAGIDWAFSNSDSEWLTFVDSDDWVHPRNLEFLYRACIEYNAEVSICCCCDTTSEDVEFHNSDFSANVYPIEEFWVLRGPNATVGPLKLYKKRLFDKIRYPVGRLHEDVATTHKILFQLDYIVHVPLDLYYYFFNPNSICRSKWTSKKFDLIISINEQIDFFIKRQLYECAYPTVLYLIRSLGDYYDYYIAQNDVPKEEMRQFRDACRKSIKDYKKMFDIKFKSNTKLYEMAYPNAMYIYWTTCGIILKIKAIWSKICRK